MGSSPPTTNRNELTVRGAENSAARSRSKLTSERSISENEDENSEEDLTTVDKTSHTSGFRFAHYACMLCDERDHVKYAVES